MLCCQSSLIHRVLIRADKLHLQRLQLFFLHWKRQSQLTSVACTQHALLTRMCVVIASVNYRAQARWAFTKWQCYLFETTAAIRLLSMTMLSFRRLRLRSAWDQLRDFVHQCQRRETFNSKVLTHAITLCARSRLSVLQMALLRWKAVVQDMRVVYLRKRAATLLFRAVWRQRVVLQLRRAFGFWVSSMLRGDIVHTEQAASLWTLRHIAGSAWRRWRIAKLGFAWAAWTRFCWCYDVAACDAARSVDRKLIKSAHAEKFREHSELLASQRLRWIGLLCHTSWTNVVRDAFQKWTYHSIRHARLRRFYVVLKKYLVVRPQAYALLKWRQFCIRNARAQSLLSSAFGLTFGAAAVRMARQRVATAFHRWRRAAQFLSWKFSVGLQHLQFALQSAGNRRVACRFLQWHCTVLLWKQFEISRSQIAIISRERRVRYLGTLTKVTVSHSNSLELHRHFYAWRCARHDRIINELTSQIARNKTKFEKLKQRAKKGRSTPLYLRSGHGGHGSHKHARYCKICQRHCLKHNKEVDPSELTFGL
mgnify:CR=1 FL=1